MTDSMEKVKIQASERFGGYYREKGYNPKEIWPIPRRGPRWGEVDDHFNEEGLNVTQVSMTITL